MVNSNAPVVNLDAALEPAALAAYVEFEYAEHTAAVAALMARNERFLSVTAEGIADDFICGHATDFAKEMAGAGKALDATHTRVKAPVLRAQRLIDGEKKKLNDQLIEATREVDARIGKYLNAKDARLRAEAEAEAKRLALEAEARIAEAQATATIEATESAVEAMEAADVAAERAEASVLDMTRTRSQSGALAGLREHWTYALLDITKVPAAFLMVNDAVVKAAIKSGTREVPGLRIFAERKAMRR